MNQPADLSGTESRGTGVCHSECMESAGKRIIVCTDKSECGGNRQNVK